MEAIEESLQGIEARMRIEARHWQTRSKETIPDTDQLKRNLAAFTGLSIRTKVDYIQAGMIIRRLLTAQRRMAKSGHPRYDANKHILLKATLDSMYLETGQIPTGEQIPKRIKSVAECAQFPANPGNT